MDRFRGTDRFTLLDLILRSPAKRSEGGRLEGWQLARPSFAAILRDALRSLSSGAHSRDPLAMFLRMRSRGGLSPVELTWSRAKLGEPHPATQPLQL
jgi:hypothetical protein